MACLLEQVLLGLQGAHAIRPVEVLEMRHGVDELQRLVPAAQVAQGPRVHDEQVDLGPTHDTAGVIALCDLDGLLRMAFGAFAIGDERQVVGLAVHAVGRAEFAQRGLEITDAIRHERIGLAREIDARRLVRDPLGVGHGGLRIGFDERIGSEDVQADVFGMFLRQAAQTLALVVGKHVPRHALGHGGFAGAQHLVGVLRRIRHSAVGIAAAVAIVGIAVAAETMLALVVAAVAVSLIGILAVVTGVATPVTREVTVALAEILVEVPAVVLAEPAVPLVEVPAAVP